MVEADLERAEERAEAGEAQVLFMFELFAVEIYNDNFKRFIFFNNSNC